MVTAHHLYNNFDDSESVAESVREGLRILKSGGTFRADGLASYFNDTHREKFLQLVFSPENRNQDVSESIEGQYAYQVLEVHGEYELSLKQEQVDACIWEKQFFGEAMINQMKEADMSDEIIRTMVDQAVQTMKNQPINDHLNTLVGQANYDDGKDYHACVKTLIYSVLPYLPESYFSLKDAPLAVHANLFYNLVDVERMLRFQEEIERQKVKNVVLLIYKY